MSPQPVIRNIPIQIRELKTPDKVLADRDPKSPVKQTGTTSQVKDGLTSDRPTLDRRTPNRDSGTDRLSPNRDSGVSSKVEEDGSSVTSTTTSGYVSVSAANSTTKR